ncbi:Conserved_hypothetical protein [Hexamita inflata]|uniref:Uncharacterized protein n=1 Tax=Hexamita inflata TaxID=28002 RepID=A0AA86UMW5_9EUKA|nr:Conserved hypothetical protein [Hexamita inflata]
MDRQTAYSLSDASTGSMQSQVERIEQSFLMMDPLQLLLERTFGIGVCEIVNRCVQLIVLHLVLFYCGVASCTQYVFITSLFELAEVIPESCLIGARSFITRYIQRKQIAATSIYFTTAFVLSLLTGLIVMLILALVPSIESGLKVDTQNVTFYKILFISAPFTRVLFISLCRAFDAEFRPTFGYLFQVVNGVAYALGCYVVYLISQNSKLTAFAIIGLIINVITLGFLFYRYVNKTEQLQLSISRLIPFRIQVTGHILKETAYTMMHTLYEPLFFMIILAFYINKTDSEKVLIVPMFKVFQILSKLGNSFNVAAGQTVGTFAELNIKMSRYDRIYRLQKFGIVIVAGTSIALGIIVFIVGPIIARDIIVESALAEDQISTFKTLAKYVKLSGIYGCFGTCYQLSMALAKVQFTKQVIVFDPILKYAYLISIIIAGTLTKNKKYYQSYLCQQILECICGCVYFVHQLLQLTQLRQAAIQEVEEQRIQPMLDDESSSKEKVFNSKQEDKSKESSAMISAAVMPVLKSQDVHDGNLSNESGYIKSLTADPNFPSQFNSVKDPMSILIGEDKSGPKSGNNSNGSGIID